MNDSTYISLGDHLAGLSKSLLLQNRRDTSIDLPRLYMPGSLGALLAVRFPGFSFDVDSLIEELEELNVDPIDERELLSVVAIEHRIR